MKTIEELKAIADKAKADADGAGGTDESLNQLQKEAEEALTQAQTDADELKRLEGEKPPLPPQKTEKEKAKYTVEQILGRHPELKDELHIGGQPVDEGTATALETKLLRNQVEGIIRSSSKTEEEIRLKLHYYDHKIVKTGNIHEDADNASWLANKGRTRNAIDEMKRNPGDIGGSGGSGGRPPIDGAPDLPPAEIRRLTQLGLRQTGPGVWEGEKVKLEWDKTAKSWKETMK